MTDKFDLTKAISEIRDPKALGVIQYLLKELSELKIENQKLRERIAVLEKNSGNSSKPPSSDIVKAKQEQRQPGKRKIGGQAKHPGVKHKLLAATEVDIFDKLELGSCPCCSGKLARNGKCKIAQQFEFVEKPVVVTQYEAIGYYCDGCKKNIYPELPSSNLGIKVQSFICHLKSAIGVSYSESCEILNDVFRVNISRSTVCNVVRRCSAALEFSHNELGIAIKQSKSVNCDETTWRDFGDIWWSWLFATDKIAYFKLASTRAASVVDSVLGADFAGAITSDFYSSYIKFKFPNQQFCLAHLIRDIRFLESLPDSETVAFAKKLLSYFRKIFELWHNKEFLQEQFTPKILCVKNKIKNLIYKVKLSGKALTMQRRFTKHWDSLFRFIDKPDLLSPTNNLAEQTIRFITRIRALTQGTRGTWGTTWIERSTSVVATCRKQKRSIYNFYLQTLTAYKNNSPFPSLIPAN